MGWTPKTCTSCEELCTAVRHYVSLVSLGPVQCRPKTAWLQTIGDWKNAGNEFYRMFLSGVSASSRLWTKERRSVLHLRILQKAQRHNRLGLVLSTTDGIIIRRAGKVSNILRFLREYRVLKGRRRKCWEGEDNVLLETQTLSISFMLFVCSNAPTPLSANH